MNKKTISYIFGILLIIFGLGSILATCAGNMTTGATICYLFGLIPVHIQMDIFQVIGAAMIILGIVVLIITRFTKWMK